MTTSNKTKTNKQTKTSKKDEIRSDNPLLDMPDTSRRDNAAFPNLQRSAQSTLCKSINQVETWHIPLLGP